MKALFLDRDGVINIDSHYVIRDEQVVLMEGILEFLREYKDLGFKLIVISNQSAVARGMATENQIHKLNDLINSKLENMIDKFYICTYHNQAKLQEYKKESYLRKPNPGMLLQAAKDFKLDFKKCFFVGDKFSDIEAGRRAGVQSIQIVNQASVIHPFAHEVASDLLGVSQAIRQALPSSPVKP